MLMLSSLSFWKKSCWLILCTFTNSNLMLLNSALLAAFYACLLNSPRFWVTDWNTLYFQVIRQWAFGSVTFLFCDFSDVFQLIQGIQHESHVQHKICIAKFLLRPAYCAPSLLVWFWSIDAVRKCLYKAG
jgi:hypothetical protein